MDLNFHPISPSVTIFHPFSHVFLLIFAACSLISAHYGCMSAWDALTSRFSKPTSWHGLGVGICEDTLKNLQEGMFRIGKLAFLRYRTKVVKKVHGLLHFACCLMEREGSLQLCPARVAQVA